MIHHLLVPGLLEPPPTAGESTPVLRAPALELLLSRGDREPAADRLETTLFELFGLGDGAAAAPFCWLADSGEEATGWVMQAAPVYLRADRDQLLLFELDEEQLSLADAEAYAAVFNEHFAEDGLKLKIASPLRWYLFPQRPVEATFSPLSEVSGRSVAAFMPGGKDAAYWAGVANEIQMLFFQLAEKRENEMQGAVPVSGLWFSSAGTLPSDRPVAPAEAEGDDCLLAGLMRYAAGTDARHALHFLDGMERARRRQDAGAWQQALDDLGHRLDRLMSDADELYLYAGYGKAYHWKKHMKYRLWRSRQRFGSVLAELEKGKQV